MSVENKTFTFIVSWALWLVMLSVLSKSRLGYVLLYYSLLLMILFVLVTEYKNLVPYIAGVMSTGDLNKNNTINTGPVVSTLPITPITSSGQSGADPDGDGAAGDPLYRIQNT